MRWAVLLVLVAFVAGCTSTSSTTVFEHGQRVVPPEPEFAPSPPMPSPYPHGFQLPVGSEPRMATIPPASAPPRAIGYNGGFEEGDAADVPGWPATGDVRRDTDLSRSGSASLILAPGSMATQTIGGVSSGEVAWLKLHYVGDGVSVLRMTLYALDEQRTAIAGVYTNHSTGFGWSDVDLGPLQLPARTQHVEVVLSVDEGGRQGAHVDDLEVAIAQADGSAFVNGGFEEGNGGWELTRFAGIDCGFSFAPEGECSLRLDHSQGGSASQRLAASGAAVSFSYTYASQVSDYSERWLFANLTFLDASGSDTRAPYSMAARMVQPGWKRAASELIPLPPGTSTLVIELAANQADPAPTWVDDVHVVWS